MSVVLDDNSTTQSFRMDLDSPDVAKLVNETQSSLLFRKKLILIGKELEKSSESSKHPLVLLLVAFKDFLLQQSGEMDAGCPQFDETCQSIVDFLKFFKAQLMNYYNFQTATKKHQKNKKSPQLG